MIRRLTRAAALAGALTAAGAAAATALPVDTLSSSRGACVAVRELDAGYCVSNPAPDAPKLKVPALPDLPQP